MAKEVPAKYIAGLDIGTTILRCFIFNNKAEVIGFASSKTPLEYTKEMHVEINPDNLWDSTVSTIKAAVENANLRCKDIKSLGISTLRSTFITWRKSNGEPFHNFITWKDNRADDLIKYWNDAFLMKAFRALTYCLYLLSFTKNKRFLCASRLRYYKNHTTLRLVWALQNVPELKEALLEDDVLFGTVDSWLIYKLTSGKHHVTDITNASATGMFDPFVRNWGLWTIKLMRLPTEIFPKVVPNDFDFGCTDSAIFGVPIPIKCVIADQSASMYGSCCFNVDDLKVTLGTGCFLNVNTGKLLHTSAAGMYPLIAWDINNEYMCMGETACNDTGTLIEWALQAGLASDPADTSFVASQVEDSDGVYFIPAFSGLGPPINDQKAATGFIGIKPSTTKSHMLRAVLESIVYRVVLSYKVLKSERDKPYQKICVDGGVSRNNFICQLLADMTGLEVERATSAEMTIMGVLFITGLASGMWKSTKELKSLRLIDYVFIPSDDEVVVQNYKDELENWLKAVDRFKSWYCKDS